LTRSWYATGQSRQRPVVNPPAAFPAALVPAPPPSGLTQPFAHTPSQDAHAFRYDGKGLTDLGTLGGSSSIGRGIGPGGHVVGDAYLAGNAGPHAFFHNGTAMADLGTLGGSVSGALAINAANTIVGEELYCNAGVSAGVPS